ncbi:MAG: STAS domain-containing protein [bacterium]
MSTLMIQQRKVMQNNKDVIILDLQGSLDAHSAPQLDSIISLLANNNSYNLVINFAKLDYISSAGMGLLVGWIDSFRSNNGDILIASLKQNVLKVFKILGFNKIFNIFDNETQALAKFN